MKFNLLRKRKPYSAYLLLILIINILLLSYHEPCLNPESQNLTLSSQKQDYKNLDLRNISREFEDSHLETQFMRVMKASGESFEIPMPTGIDNIRSISMNGKTTLFINDQKGGEKIDLKLKDYTFLLDNDYINEDKIQVILLPGLQISRDIYAIKPLSNTDVSQIKNRLQSFKGNILSKFNNFPFLTVDLPYYEIFDLAEQDYIAHIFLDKKVYACLDESVPIIKPPTTWQQLETQFGLDINGTNIKIAILDTGIDKNHPDLNDLDDNLGTSDPKIIAEECFTGQGYTWDDHGHGTHCASIAAGTGEASSYTHVGVAPGALLLNGKVLNNYGSGFESWIINGIEWAVEQSTDIISMSLSIDLNSDGTDPLSLAIDWANDQGIVCTIAAGNDGEEGMFSVDIPAVAKKAIAVGSTTKTDQISSFSSQGPSTDYRIKPDVCAPGSNIVAARASGTSLGTPIDNYYTSVSGTSMATPHVAGAAALMLQIHPNWSPLMIKSALMGNTKILYNEHLWRQGAGRIDIAKAINTTLLIIDPSSSFGLIELGETLDKTLTLINLGNTPTMIDLSTYTLCDGIEINYVSLNDTSLTIPANSNASISLEIGPLDLNAPEGWYEGWVNISGSQNNKTAPYWFMGMSSISVTVYDIDDTTPIYALIALTHYPNMSLIQIHDTNGESSAQFGVKSGQYALCAQMAWIDNGSLGNIDYSRMFMLEKNITVAKFSNLNISLSLAEAQIHTIPTIDSSDNNLIIHSYTQYFCGGPHTVGPYFKTHEWYLQASWWALDLDISHLTFYSSNYTQPDRLCEAIGLYAHDQLFSEVYLVPLKYWNISSLPDILYCPKSDFAKYNVFYDMPETYPEDGLNITNQFWFTWDYLGGEQEWWEKEFHSVPAGMNATYYLAPGNGTYFGSYYSTYKGWGSFFNGPREDWSIGRHSPYPQIPLNKGETGNITLGRFSFSPYNPGLNLNILDLGNEFLLNLTGDIWRDLSWPHVIVETFIPQHGYLSPYPQYFANFELYINGTLYDQGQLNGNLGYNNLPYIYDPPFNLDVDWCGINKSWTLTGGDINLGLNLPSLATLYSNTTYNLAFSLNNTDFTPPILDRIFCPTNFTPGEDIFINFTTFETGSGIFYHYLKYSFDDGETWQLASYENPYYRVPCIEADALSLGIFVADNAGNVILFHSKPVALSNKVKLNVPLEISAFTGDPIIISGNLTSLEGSGLPRMTVFATNDSKSYAMTDDNGNFIIILPPINTPGNYTYNITSASAGLYDQEEISITLLLTVDVEPPSWIGFPMNQIIEFGDDLIYDLDAIDLAGISHWWVNDTVNFSIDNNGIITNNVFLPIGVFGVQVWVNDTHGNIQNASFNIIVRDTTSPKWNPTPSDYVIEFGDDLIYDLDATDLSGIDEWWINDTTHFSIDEYGTITNAITLNSGDYWLEVRAYDPHDNYCSQIIKITVEKTPSPPLISGYDLIFLFGVILIVAVVFMKKRNF
ncbi:MAG: S8 family serine peptidase [Candidatus Hodarchaeota archaeon]